MGFIDIVRDPNGEMSIQVNPHPAQKLALNSTRWLTLVSAGTGGGKTEMGIYWCYKQMTKRWRGKPLYGMIGMPTRDMYSDIILPGFIEFFQGILNAGEYMKSKKKFVFTSLFRGSEIYFKYSTEPNIWEGKHVDFIWVDEVGQKGIPKSLLDVVLDRTRMHGGSILFTTTPYPDNMNSWVYSKVVKKSYQVIFNVEIDKMYELWKNGKPVDYKSLLEAKILKIKRYKPKNYDPNFLTIVYPNIINPSYPLDKHFHSYEESDYLVYRMRHLGQWFESSERVFYAFNEAVHVVEPFEIPDSWTRFIGVDYGEVHPFAVVWIAFDPEHSTYYIYREYQKRMLDNMKHAQNVYHLNRGDGLRYVFGDPTGGARNENRGQNYINFLNALRKLGLELDFKQTYSAKSQSIGIMNKLFAQKKLFVFANCEQLIDEYTSLTVSDLTKKHPANNLSDASRYGVVSHYKQFVEGYEGKPREEETAASENENKKYREFIRSLLVGNPDDIDF